jgi:hypothetical protein
MFHSQELNITLDAETASGTSAVAGTVLDMSGYEGVIFAVKVATANAGNYLNARDGSVSGTVTTDLAGTKVVAGADGDVLVLDVNKPAKRYIRAYVVRTAATVLGSILSLRYGSRTPPETPGNVRKVVQSPAAGTP